MRIGVLHSSSTVIDKVWNEYAYPTSTYAFATEKVAMMIAPSWRAHEVIDDQSKSGFCYRAHTSAEQTPTSPGPPSGLKGVSCQIFS
jgi:ABC-type glycerol-3-phosphate transport system substrate-binding protein